jgi:hypothetical protein
MKFKTFSPDKNAVDPMRRMIGKIRVFQGTLAADPDRPNLVQHGYVDEDGYEVVDVAGGDMGRAYYPDGHALKRLSDGTWLIVLEGKSEKELAQRTAACPTGYALYGSEMGFPPVFCVYGASGGIAHSYLAYLVYPTKPEVALEVDGIEIARITGLEVPPGY